MAAILSAGISFLKYVADEQSPFEWNIPAARGTVAHKAIELLIGRRIPRQGAAADPAVPEREGRFQ